MAKKVKKDLGGKIVTEPKKPISKKEKTVIWILSVVIALGVIAGVVLGALYGAGAFEKETPTLHVKSAENGYKKYYVTGERVPGVYAVMTITDGTETYDLDILLMKDLAPITVNNFIRYAEDGFYDGTAFHRIVPTTYTFQGGGFTYEKETGYKEKKATYDAIRGEFASNPTGEYEYNILSHFAGTISMARTNDKNSATSQFFFSWASYPAWDGDYAAFGFLVDLEDVLVLKRLGENAKTDENDRPISPITITKVEIIEIK